MRKSRKREIVGINAKVARNINRSIILNSIRERQPISRITISKMTGLNKSTVSRVVASLIAEDLIVEELDRNEVVGRNPFNLRVKKGTHFVGAICFESARTELAVVDVDGSIKSKVEIRTEAQNPREFIARCVNELEKLGTHLNHHRLRGIGVTVGGIVDSLQSKVVYAPDLGWENLDMGEIIRAVSPDIEMITIENDANASALAELLLGKHGLSSSSIVFVFVGYGIGAGIVLDNHILSGSSHAAGEFGHMTIVERGEQCSCGNQGCWEVYASDHATIRRYVVEKGLSEDKCTEIQLSDIIELAKNEDAIARSVLSKTAAYIGLGIANIIRSFDPQVIIIGGSITQAWDLVYPQIMETVERRGFFAKQHNTAILPTTLTDSPPLLGAAALSIRKIFDSRRIAL